MTSLRPKKLTLREMWQIHRKYKEENGQPLLYVADIIYPKRKQVEFTELLYLVINGLTHNGYSTFTDFIKSLSNGN